jgi:hypothetical protein
MYNRDVMLMNTMMMTTTTMTTMMMMMMMSPQRAYSACTISELDDSYVASNFNACMRQKVFL